MCIFQSCAIRYNTCFKIVSGGGGIVLWGVSQIPVLTRAMEGALGRLSLVFFLHLGLPLVLQKLLFTEPKI